MDEKTSSTTNTHSKDVDRAVGIGKHSIQAEHAEEISEAVAIEHTLSFWQAVKI